MAGIPVDKLGHSCGTTKGLQVFADTTTGEVDGYCFSCGTFVKHPYGKPKTIDQIDLPLPKTPEEIAEEIAEIKFLGSPSVSSRKLRGEYLEAFGIKVGLSEEDGTTQEKMFFPQRVNGEITGYYIKTLTHPKFMWSVGEVKNAELFGWHMAKRSGAYKLIITEGMEDAVATLSVFSRYGKEEYMPAICSLTNGVQSVRKNLTPIAGDIRAMFKEVVLCFDDDEPGRAAVKEAMLLLPEATVAKLPEKDMNDCLIKGAGKAAYKALSFQAQTPKNTRLIIAGPELHSMAREPTPYGELTWFSPTMQKLLRGVRLGETIYEGAGVKMGKSELLNMQAAHHILHDNVPVMVAKPEEALKKTYKLMAGKMVGKVFHDPEVEFDYEAYDKAGAMLADKLATIDMYQHMGWDTLRSDIVHAANLGYKAVFIDPITNLTAGMSAADANQFLTGFARDISSISKDKGIVTFLFCHLKAPEGNLSADQREKKYREGKYVDLGNCPHEAGGSIYSSQFAGSRAMMQSCNLMLGLEGNKDPSLDDGVRNMRWLKILEDREFGNAASIPLFWNRRTTMFKEMS